MRTAAVLAGTAAAALAHGAFHRNSPLFGAVVRRAPGRGRRVALTFDDGPNPEATPAILDALGALGVRATFFVLGRHAERWPELVRRAAQEGHEVANHGYHHRKLHLSGPRRAHADVARGAEAIAAAGAPWPRLFRAPHGFRSPWVSPAAAALGQRTVGWTLGVWDSDRPGAAEIARRTVAGTRPGGIVLLHDGDGYDAAGDRRQTAEAVPPIVEGLRARGYRFVPLA